MKKPFALVLSIQSIDEGGKTQSSAITTIYFASQITADYAGQEWLRDGPDRSYIVLNTD